MSDFVSLSIAPSGGQAVLLAGEWDGTRLRVYQARVCPIGNSGAGGTISVHRFVNEVVKKEVDHLKGKVPLVYLVVEATRTGVVVGDVIRGAGHQFPTVISTEDVLEEAHPDDVHLVPERDLKMTVQLALESGKLEIAPLDQTLADLKSTASTGGTSSDAVWSALAAMCWHARRVGVKNGFRLF